MPRPIKWRRVCCMPDNTQYGPIGQRENADVIVMTVDEYETIRLIDLEGLNQEECAEQMNIARTTAQRIYIDARKKLADSLVNGKILRIEGGEFRLCEGREKGGACRGCRRARCHTNGD